MSFDPYHKWLGIPPRDQPPNHYRLLGLELFEEHTDVICNAADQRMAHVKSFALKHRVESQTILNELAMARVVLSDPKKKCMYDDFLRETLAEKSPVATPRAPPRQVPTARANSSPLSTLRQGRVLGPSVQDLEPLEDRNLLDQSIQPVGVIHPVCEKPKKGLPKVLLAFVLLYSFCVSFVEFLQGLYALLMARRPQSPYLPLFALLCLGLAVALLIAGVIGRGPVPNPLVREDVFCRLKPGQSESELFNILGKPSYITHGKRVRFFRPGERLPSFTIEEDDSCDQLVYAYVGENKSDQIKVLLSNPGRDRVAAVYLYKDRPLGYAGPTDEKCDLIEVPFPRAPTEDVETRARITELENYFAANEVKN